MTNMTPKQAILRIKEHNRVHQLNERNAVLITQALDMACAALELQIPKRPIRKKWTVSKCPNCGADLGEYLSDGYTTEWESMKFCDCGQRIDWSWEQPIDEDEREI